MIKKQRTGRYTALVVVENVEHVQTQQGKTIVFLKVSDATATLSKLMAMNPTSLAKDFIVGQMLCLNISLSRRLQQQSFFVDKIFTAS